MEKINEPDIQRLLASDSWRVFRIISEFVDGFETMTHIGPSVSIFGSAKIQPNNPYYEMSFNVAREIAKRGFAIITGGGPGIMEAANKGAQSVNGRSCGLMIEIPTEEWPNNFIDAEYSIKFRYFFIRKVMFIRYAQGYIFLPGGFGTLDELFAYLSDGKMLLGRVNRLGQGEGAWNGQHHRRGLQTHPHHRRSDGSRLRN
jgi:uncharacterized protein (TIGR00730 family)